MQYSITKPTKEDYLEIVDVWEASVRATHDFLPESDILFFRPLILDQYLDHVELACVRDGEEKILGFLGTAENKVEMLFIHPDQRGKGIGKQLMEYAIKEKRTDEVDVNEQNEQAVGFYKRLGFKVVSRSEVDGLGKPYPMLHMALSVAN